MRNPDPGCRRRKPKRWHLFRRVVGRRLIIRAGYGNHQYSQAYADPAARANSEPYSSYAERELDYAIACINSHASSSKVAIRCGKRIQLCQGLARPDAGEGPAYGYG